MKLLRERRVKNDNGFSLASIVAAFIAEFEIALICLNLMLITGGDL